MATYDDDRKIIISPESGPIDVNIEGGTVNVNTVTATVDVQLSHANDSVKVGDGVDFLAINADGSINVTVAGGGGGLTDAELRATPVTVSGTVAVTAAALPLPSGAATSAKQDSLLTELQGKADLTETQPVSVAAVVHVDDNAGSLTVDSADLATIAAKDFATQTTLALIKAKTDNLDVALSTRTKPADQQHAIVDSGTLTAVTSITNVVHVDDNAGSLTVDGTFWQATQPVSFGGNATGTLANVGASVTNVTLQASNASRKGLTIYNDSTSVLYVKLGATASATSFTVKMQADDYYEVPANYTGIVDGIWVAANGNARVTEIT